MLTWVVRAVLMFMVGIRVLGPKFEETSRVKTAAFLSIWASVLVFVYGSMSCVVPLGITNATSIMLEIAISVCIFAFWASGRYVVRGILGCNYAQVDRVLARMGVYMAVTWSLLHFITFTAGSIR